MLNKQGLNMVIIIWRVIINAKGIHLNTEIQDSIQKRFSVLATDISTSTWNNEDFIWSYLVGGWPTPLKNMKVSWDDDIPNWIEK